MRAGRIPAPTRNEDGEDGGGGTTSISFLMAFGDVNRLGLMQVRPPVIGRADPQQATAGHRCHACAEWSLAPPPCNAAVQQHWMTTRLSIPFTITDLGAAVPPNAPVLNKGAGPAAQVSPSPPPPAVASPPSPPPAPVATCAVGASCCLNGVEYSSCQTDSGPGFAFSQFYRSEGTTLHVAIK